jgi:HrpA-like RNA helicase
MQIAKEDCRRRFASSASKKIFRHFLIFGSKRTQTQTQTQPQVQPDPLTQPSILLRDLQILSACLCGRQIIMSQSPNPYTNKPYSAADYVVHRQTRELPVSRRMPQLLETIQNNSVTILVGETGSGKSTQLPKYILESMSGAFNGDICPTQPRKLAAETVSLMITITSSNDIH